MKEIKVYKPIDKEDVFFSYFGEDDPFAFSADAIHKVFDSNPDETEFKFSINCDGGSVAEGLRIYDVIRTSGKTIHCNIEGSCHSMAVVLLLAAPKENRTANPNARALIHEVRGGSWDVLKADELREYADEIDREQNAILDIYADRTGHDRAALEVLMKEEKIRTSNELLNYGFIEKINTYTTNLQNPKKMNKPRQTVQELLNRAAASLSKISNLLDGPVNYEFKSDEGEVLFTTEKEDDSITVGDAASPDGTFTIADGRTVVIADGVITEIQEAAEPEDAVDTENEIAMEELTNQVEELTNSLTEAKELINELKDQVQSTYNAATRKKPIGNKVDTKEEEKFTFKGKK